MDSLSASGAAMGSRLRLRPGPGPGPQVQLKRVVPGKVLLLLGRVLCQVQLQRDAVGCCARCSSDSELQRVVPSGDVAALVGRGGGR